MSQNFGTNYVLSDKIHLVLVLVDDDFDCTKFYKL